MMNLRGRSGAGRCGSDIRVAVTLLLLVFAGACSGGGAPSSRPPPVPGEELTVSPVFEASRPVADCTASLGTASGPVVLAATISCARKGIVAAVGAGVAGAGHVVVSGSDGPAFSRVLSISATGAVSADEGPASSGTVAGLVVQPDGAADLVGTSTDLGLAFFRAADGGWMREPVAPPTSANRLSERYNVYGLGRAADGTVHIYTSHTIDLAFNNHLLTRAPSGQWTFFDLPMLVGVSDPALAVRPAGEPVVVYLARSEDGTEKLDAWSNGDIPTFAPVDLGEDLADLPDMISAAADAAGVTAGLQTPRQGVVLYRRAGASPRTVTLAGTAAPAPVGCPALPKTSTTEMAPRACTETGTGGARQHALVLGADGTAWVAYLVVHLDRDMSQSCGPDSDGTSFYCYAAIITDRSTLEVVLERVAANGTHAVKWRAPAGPSDFGSGSVFMDRRDALLHLAYSSGRVADLPPPSVEYAVVDTTRL